MPIVIDRRRFLKNSLYAAAAIGAGRLKAAPESVRWALLSDTHLSADPNDVYRGFRPSENFAKVTGQVLAMPFDSILVNGDLARLEGTPADYAAFSSYANRLADHAPVAITMGNHDQRENAAAGLHKLASAAQLVAKKLVTTMASGPLQFVLLDSLLATNIAPGQLGKAQRAWLAKYLSANTGKPTVIVVHHNPDTEGDNALLDSGLLLAIVKPLKHVKAIVFGHTHTYRFADAEGIKLINLPAVGYNFTDGEAIGWVEAALRADGAELKLHAIGGTMRDDGKTTSLTWR